MTGARHDLLQLTAAGWAAFAARDPGRAATGGLRTWARHDLPVMRRRPQPGDQAALIPVAVSLPAAEGRARVAFQVAAADIAANARPPFLREAVPGLPERFGTRAEAVLALAAATGLTPRLFGSAMWQHVTGLPYLHAHSDLDLLWDVPRGPDRAAAIGRLVASLRALEASPGPRLDGEIVLDGARAVNWRELAPEGPDEILVKTGEAVLLMPRASFLHGGPASC